MLSTRQACVLVGGMDRLVTDMLRSNRDARLAGRTALLGSWCAFERADGVVGIKVRIWQGRQALSGEGCAPTTRTCAARIEMRVWQGRQALSGKACAPTTRPCQTELCFGGATRPDGAPAARPEPSLRSEPRTSG